MEKPNREILIGIHGRAGTGKDIAARYLAERFGFMHLAFADHIKKALVILFRDTHGLTHEHFSGTKKERVIEGFGKSPRQLMQSFGTEWGREKVNPDVWIMIVHALIKARREILSRQNIYFPGAVISDVRFNNEAQWIRSQGGVVIHLYRQAAKPVNPHVSELGIDSDHADVVISNDGTFEALHKKLNDIVLGLIETSGVGAV